MNISQSSDSVELEQEEVSIEHRSHAYLTNTVPKANIKAISDDYNTGIKIANTGMVLGPMLLQVLALALTMTSVSGTAAAREFAQFRHKHTKNKILQVESTMVERIK